MEKVQVEAGGGQAIEELIDQARRRMEETGYSRSSRGDYGRVWEALKRFARDVEKTNQFSVGLVERFLACNGYPAGNYPQPMPRSLKRRLNALRLLTEFWVCGHIQPKRHPDRRLSLSPHFQQVLAEYERECERTGMGRSSLRKRREYLPALLLFLQRTGVEHLSQIRAAHTSDFLLAQAHHCTGTIAIKAAVTRCFLRYLQRRDILQDDVAAAMPHIRRCRHAKIPTVWSAEQVEKLLAQVDRGSPQGKRDYAILLLAARLGMRVGDIVRLQLEHLNWEERRIELPQAKTGQPLALPLTEEVGWALIDYLRNGRPTVVHREVFLWCKTPFCPFVHNDNLEYIITKYRRRAGIPVTPEQTAGLHTLRHSLASRLLSNGIPLPTIADILGHRSTESTRIYTKVDLPQLQDCALDPEAVHHA